MKQLARRCAPGHPAAVLLPVALCEDLTARVRNILAGDLVGLYLHGSSVQGDFREHTSDLDVLGVVVGEIDDTRLERLAEVLEAIAKSLPVTGLEFILCAAEVVAAPPAEPRYVFALSAGPVWPTAREDAGTTTDLLIHFVLCQQAGITLHGPDAAHLFGPVSRLDLKRALLNEIQWYRQNTGHALHDPAGFQAVLNAARSVHAAETGHILSKTEGGRWYLARHPEHRLVAEALALRRGDATVPLRHDAVLAFLQRARDLIEAT